MDCRFFTVSGSFYPWRVSHSTTGGSTADFYFPIVILLIFSILSFGFLLSPVGQCDTDHGCRNGGQWYNMEEDLARLRTDNPTAIIKVEITPKFPVGISPDHGGPIRRPESFEVNVFLNNGPIANRNYNIANP